MNEWISVKDRLPETNVCVHDQLDPKSDWVIIYSQYYGPCIGQLRERTDNLYEWNHKEYFLWGTLKDVTHWMPLPEEPNEFILS